MAGLTEIGYSQHYRCRGGPLANLIVTHCDVSKQYRQMPNWGSGKERGQEYVRRSLLLFIVARQEANLGTSCPITGVQAPFDLQPCNTRKPKRMDFQGLGTR